MLELLPYWVATAYLQTLSPQVFLALLECFDDIRALFTASTDELIAKGASTKLAKLIMSVDWKLVEADLRWAENADNYLICFDDPRYPVLLKEIADPPLLLFVRGNIKSLSTPQLAMVGARKASMQGVKHANQFAAALASSGMTITSGLARGIDAESHAGCLSVNGITIGVLGTGVDIIYPRRNEDLAQHMLASGGAIVSELPRSTWPAAYQFPRRNRIVAGMSMGVLVIEAALKSGSLISARLAMEAGREVFALPGPIGHPLSKGCHALIRQGAKLVEMPSDIIDELCAFRPIFTSSATYDTKPRDLVGLSPAEQQVLNLVGFDPTPMDGIILTSGLTASEVSSILLTLELDGHIESRSDGYVKATHIH